MKKESKLITKPPKFYSQRGISIATFLGSPLAASYLIRNNFIQAGEDEKGKIALIIGVVFTFAVFASVILLPDEIHNKIPNTVIPLVYAAIVYALVERFQGPQLREYKDNGNQFISNWKATGIGLIGMLIIMTPIGLYAYYEASNPIYETYDRQMEKFVLNESSSLRVYDHISIHSPNQLSREIKQKSIPLWEKNKGILAKLDTTDGITNDLIRRNQTLREYCDLRILEFSTIEQAIRYETSLLDNRIDSISKAIDIKLKELQ